MARHGMVKALSAALMKRGRRRKRRMRIPEAQRSRIPAKISKLRHEGVPQKQAVGMAHGMARAGRLGPKGGYRRGGRS